MGISPICFFAYNRLHETKLSLESLKSNFLSPKTDLFIFSDGPKDNHDNKKVVNVRNYLRTINGFKSVTIFENKKNRGLAKSVIAGVTKILKLNPSVIVVEDDLITSKNFLDFMNQALKFYESQKKILSISGYTLNLKSLPINEDVYFGYRASSWGWATWSEHWNKIDWDVIDFHQFCNDKNAIKKFKRGGSDMPRMLKKQMTGKIDSWAIRFCYHQFKNDLITVFPTVSKLKSIGYSKSATHTFGTKRFFTKIDIELKRHFRFKNFNKIDNEIIKEFRSFFSIKNRIKDRLNRFLKF